MKYAICNEIFKDWDWATTCHQVAAMGYEGIEVAPFTLAEDIRRFSAHARKVHRDTAQREGLKVVGLHWLLVSPTGLSLTSDAPEVRTETADYLAALVDLCADLGGRILVLGSPRQRRLPGDPSEALSDRRERAIQRLEACLQPALKRAEQHNTLLLLEPLPSSETDFLLTLGETTELLLRFNHPNLQTIFDVKSACSEGVPLAELIHTFADRIAHVHANDANRQGPGYGDTDFSPIFAALHAIQYTGFVSVEAFEVRPDPVTVARTSLDYLKQQNVS